MRVVKRVRGYAEVIGQARRNRGDLVGWLGRRPQIAAATLTYETALLFSNKLDPRLKELAELKTAGLVACQFCLDIGSALAHTAGLTEQQLVDAGVLPGVVRISVGIEDVEDIIDDLDQALSAATGAAR